jgi:hypothetical protein
VKLSGYRLLRFLLFPHGLFELPGQYTFNGDGFDLFPNSFLFEEAIEG